MRKIVCVNCGCPEATDLFFRILCTQKNCRNFDPKLKEERRLEKVKKQEIDFYIGNNGEVVEANDFDITHFDLLDLDDLAD